MPILYIRFRRKRRLKAFGTQLPFALDLIKGSLEAGHSLPRALQVLIGEFADPLGRRIPYRAGADPHRSAARPRAGGHASARAGRRPQTAGRRGESANRNRQQPRRDHRTFSEIVRIRQRLRLQIKALTAQSRMGGLVVGLLPAMVLCAFSVIQPGYTDTLFHDPTGQMILKAAFVMDLMASVHYPAPAEGGLLK